MTKKNTVCQNCNKPIFQAKDGKWYHRHLVDSQPIHEIMPKSSRMSKSKGANPMDIMSAGRQEAKARLEMEIGYIFPHGITDTIFDFCAAFDAYKIPKEKLEDMCKKAGLRHTGEKKLLAARLLANEFGRHE